MSVVVSGEQEDVQVQEVVALEVVASEKSLE